MQSQEVGKFTKVNGIKPNPFVADQPDQVRIPGCVNYEQCLHYATVKKWAGMTCKYCGVFQSAMAALVTGEILMTRITIDEKMEQLSERGISFRDATIENPSIAIATLVKQLKETGDFDKLDLSSSSVYRYIKSERAALKLAKRKTISVCTECGHKECICCDDEIDSMVKHAQSVDVRSMPTIDRGFVVLPSGAIWTPDEESAISLSRRITSK